MSLVSIALLLYVMMMTPENIRIDRTISGWVAPVDLAKRPTPESQFVRGADEHQIFL